MEVLGAVASGFTLAALFKYSFDALNYIQLYQTQDVDFNRLQLQFKLEKCRLYSWGDTMGLAHDSKESLLSEWHSKDLVAETLQQIIDFFSDVQAIQKKYGCGDLTTAAHLLPAHESSHGITRAFDHFRIQASNIEERMSPLKKTRWVIRDRKKFVLLVSEVRSLIDSLEKITSDLSSTARLEEFLRIRINGITNVDTLHGIASLWKESHPRVASEASTKADSISENIETFDMIFQWRDSVGSEASTDTTIADLENLSVTELKHFIVSSSAERETLRKSLETTSGSVESLQQQLSTLRDNKPLRSSALIAIIIGGVLPIHVPIAMELIYALVGLNSWMLDQDMYTILVVVTSAGTFIVTWICICLALYLRLHYFKTTAS